MGCSMDSSIIDELNNINRDYYKVISVLRKSLSSYNECNINGLVIKLVNNEIYVEKREGNKIISTIYFKIDDSNPYRIIYIQTRDKNDNFSLRKRLSLVFHNNESTIIPRNPTLEEIEIITDMFNILLSKKKIKVRRKYSYMTNYY